MADNFYQQKLNEMETHRESIRLKLEEGKLCIKQIELLLKQADDLVENYKQNFAKELKD